MRKRTYVMGVVFTSLIFIGVFLRAVKAPGAGAVLFISTLLFILVFSTSYTIDKITLEKKRIAKISHVVLALAMVFILWGGLFVIMRYPGSRIFTTFGLMAFCIYMVFFTRHTEGRKLIMQKDRQLASILFTDIVGFTKMMGEDEDKALQALDRNRSIQKRLIRKFRGKWIKEMGDGAIAVFFSASEAINCAMTIQKEVQEKEEFRLSMGIHVSEILFTEKDIFGDGVNVASRIASNAEANEIWFSTTVFENIRNREDIEIVSMGPQQLKNVVYDVNLYKIVT